MRETIEILEPGRDNIVSLFLTTTPAQTGLSSVLADLSAITRVLLVLGDTTIDSDVVGSEVIWWTDQKADENDNGTLKDVLKLRLGAVLQSLELPSGDYEQHVVAYDSDHALGLAYRDDRLIFRIP
jgi:hypothetical protein